MSGVPVIVSGFGGSFLGRHDGAPGLGPQPELASGDRS
ncbi:MAG: hypothetical protein AVDCRST_MAG59-3032 [uncultured Thermomicrobiales bacterium]|uniref:Uncharacterized protein n=1 Tax=uncultured Thermomicrobiales bacterium TaxID=1645740 RepID=A0A6J4V274_9BACT|nr:MAG: hypothetical protein AVDCRST_MAG59-3032 [uncultured Thermomicrobiales bacterium]